MLLAAPPAPPAGHPAAIAFWDLRRGLYVRGSRVSLTTDGGRTFHIVLRAPQPVTGMQTFGPRGAIADIADAGALRTLDGGRTWKPFRHVHDADFASPKIGLGFTTGRFELVRRFFATTNGGASWRARRSPCTRVLSFSVAVELVTPRLVWATCVGQPSAGQQPKGVFSTTDGGRTWRRRGELSWSGYVWGTSFARDGFGLVWESRGTLYVTRDGGDHWTALPKLAQPEIDFGAGGAAFAGGQGLVFLGRGDRSGRLLVTRDYGRTWRLVHRWG